MLASALNVVACPPCCSGPCSSINWEIAPGFLDSSHTCSVTKATPGIPDLGHTCSVYSHPLWSHAWQVSTISPPFMSHQHSLSRCGFPDSSQVRIFCPVVHRLSSFPFPTPTAQVGNRQLGSWAGDAAPQLRPARHLQAVEAGNKGGLGLCPECVIATSCAPRWLCPKVVPASSCAFKLWKLGTRLGWSVCAPGLCLGLVHDD